MLKVLRRTSPFILSVILVSCSSYVPSYTEKQNCCELFKTNFSWYKAARASRDEWGVPIPLQLAIIFQESSFKYNAAPDRNYLLGFIPWSRKSSAYGYAQVLKGTWSEYEKERPGFLISKSRNSFDHSTDFIGWYLHKASIKLGVNIDDAYSLYLAYHERINGYKQKTYLKKPGLMRIA